MGFGPARGFLSSAVRRLRRGQAPAVARARGALAAGAAASIGRVVGLGLIFWLERAAAAFGAALLSALAAVIHAAAFPLGGGGDLRSAVDADRHAILEQASALFANHDFDF